MVRFICNPQLKVFFDQFKERINNHKPCDDIVFIAEFYPNLNNDIHGGLVEAVKYRITHNSQICIFSFLEKDELYKYDIFGILSFAGTHFVRLPFQLLEFYKDIEEHTCFEPAILKAAWMDFSTIACKRLIREKLAVLNHGNKLDFINLITGPLRAAAVGSNSFPVLLESVKQHLRSVLIFTTNEEIKELFILSKACSTLTDKMLQLFTHFMCGLQRLEIYAMEKEINIKHLIFEIDLINESYSKIFLNDGTMQQSNSFY